MSLASWLAGLCGPPPPPPPNPFDEKFLYEYSLSRYKEIDEVVTRTRSAGQSLLTWQTAFLLGCLGIEAKAGILGYEPQKFWIYLLALGADVCQILAIVWTARVAFWAENADIPTDPRTLSGAFYAGGISGRRLVQTLVGVYDSTRAFLARLQSRLQLSLRATAIGLFLFVLLFTAIALWEKPVFERLFDIKRPQASAF